MGDDERFIYENALVDAIADDCAASRVRIAAEEANVLRRMADAWSLAQEQIGRIASATSRMRDMPLRCISTQIALELHMNDRTVQTKLHNAWRLVNDFDPTVKALERGAITKAHADVILDIGGVLDDAEVRAAFETVVLEWAEQETVGRTRAYARQLVEQFDPRSMAERHAAASDERSITLVDLDNGMSQIIALLPTAEAHGIVDRLTRQANAVKKVELDDDREARAAAAAAKAAAEAAGARAAADETAAEGEAAGLAPSGAAAAEAEAAGLAAAEADTAMDAAADVPAAGSAAARPDADPAADANDEGDESSSAVEEPEPIRRRTIDQTRADIFMDTLLTGTPCIDPTRNKVAGGLGAIQAQVQLLLPITTLTGVSQGGAEIDGRAPIDPETARLLAGNTSIWDRLLFDPVKSIAVTVDRYKQTPAQERFLRARDRRCRMPGCRRPARYCQIDHNHEHHEGGSTTICNLACLCVRHHTLKTETDWTVRQLDDGSLEFFSPSGRSYIDRPPPIVAFVPDPEPAPF